MIITEHLTINGKAFVRTSSDAGYMVERDGVLYSEAVDPVEFGRTYNETDVKSDGFEELGDEEFAPMVEGVL